MRRVHLSLCLSLGLVSVLACGQPEGASEAEEAAREAANEATRVAAGASREASEATREVSGTTQEAVDEAGQAAITAGAAAAAAGQAGAAGAAAGATAGQAQGLQALGQILAAASQTPEGDTPCEQAYHGAQALYDALRQQQGGTNGGMRFPDADEFNEICLSLPAEAQQCMVMSYAASHREECEAALDSPEVQQARAMMQGRRAAAANMAP